MIVDDLLDALARTPDAPAFLVHGRGRALTRGDLRTRAEAVAAGLHHRGIAAGDTVALALRPGPDALAVVLASLRLRARVALVDPAAGPELVTARLRAAEVRLVVADRAVRAAAGWAAPLARRRGLRLPRLADLAPVVDPGDLARPGAAPDRRGEDADALVVFTSGTTGAPRAVVHTVGSLSAGVEAVSGLVDVVPDVPVLGATMFVMGPALLAGAPVLRAAPRRASLASQVERHRPQLTYLTPPQARDLLALRPRLTGTVVAGSAPVTAGLLGRLREAGATEALGVYAMTEAFPVAVVTAADKVAYEGPGDLLGRPVGGARVRAAAVAEGGQWSSYDVDRGDDAAPSRQLLISGPTTADRYLGDAPLAAVATGDAGEVLADGRVVLHGRLKDMVLRRAENIYPGLYEPSLHVDGVAVALLVGVPTIDGDEDLVLVAEPERGVDPREVHRRLRAPLAAMGTARPDRVVVSAVPTTGRSRKPDRQAAAALAARVSPP